jgi:hypothetical protein
MSSFDLTLAYTSAASLPRTHPEPLCELIDGVLIQSAFRYQSKRTRNGARGPLPSGQVGRTFRSATQARTIPGLLRGARRPIEGHILALGRSRWTDRPAVNSSGAHRNEDAAVEARIARRDSPVASIVIEIHAENMPETAA